MPDEADREVLIARWLDLMRHQLPAAAVKHDWPIRLDHCFMRVCLDAAYGCPWHQVVRRPAIRHAAAADLRRAIAVAEGILGNPPTLPALNRASLAGRAKLAPDDPDARRYASGTG